MVCVAAAMAGMAGCSSVVERGAIAGLKVAPVKGSRGGELQIHGTDANSAFIISSVREERNGDRINLIVRQTVTSGGVKPGQGGTFDYTLKIPAEVNEVTFGKEHKVIWKRKGH